MVCRLVSVLAGAAALFAAGAAVAADYVVVASNDPDIVRGQALDAGARIALPAGGKLTLMHASGDFVTVQGAAGGVVLPKRAANQADADRLAILKLMVAPPARQVASGIRTRGAGICPSADVLTSLDAIAQAQQARCSEPAREALEAWLSAHAPSEP